MNMKAPFLGAFVAIIIILQGFSAPLASAQVYAPVGYGQCPSLWSNLSRGMSDLTTGGQVSQLQSFLVNRYGDYRLVGGFFGPLTQSYVVRYQREVGLSPVGIVGPMTRATIASACGTPYPTPTPIPTPSPLSITSVGGPSTLVIGQQGTWNIKTNAPSGSYVSVSVRWGDENPYAFVNAPSLQSYVSQQNTFSHAYANSGIYTITFTATDQFGRSNAASATVTVEATSQGQGTVSANPTSGSVPLSVSIMVRNVSPSSAYYIDYGDGLSEQLATACPMNALYDSVSGCVAATTHTYTRPGIYTARVTASALCPQGMYCAQYLRNVGSVTITVYGRSW